MELYFYTGNTRYAATTLADLALLIAALADESDPTNAATIDRVTGKIQPLVQSDTGEPLTLHFYDDADTPAAWVSDAAVALAIGLGYADANSSYSLASTSDTTIAGTTRTATLALNTARLTAEVSKWYGMSGPLGYRNNPRPQFVLHLRKTEDSIAETVALLPVQVAPGVLTNPVVDDPVTQYITNAELTAAIAGLSTVYQPLDADLTAIAALTTQSAGRSLLTLAAVPSGALVGISDTQTLTNKDLSAASNTYRAATTSAIGAIELATSAEATTGTSTTLVPTVSGAANVARMLAGFDTQDRNSSSRVDHFALEQIRSKWLGLTPNGLNIAQAVTLGERRNVWEYTENVGASWYSVTSLTKGSGTEVITVDGITLRRLYGTNHFFGRFFSSINGLGLTPFVTGEYYLASFYVFSAKAIEHWPVLSRNDSTSYNFERKYIPPHQLTRVWTLWRAKSTSTVDRGDLATIAYGSGATQFNCLWPISGGYPSATVMSTGSSVENSIDYYVGGFQIERITSDGKYGFAAIGDSTTQLNGVTAFVDRDYAESQDWPGFLAAHLNVQGFNRGIGGNTAAMMDARWASDITPIAARCKYVLIQPSWHNDRDTALVDIQTSVNSMVAKAVADGLIPVLVVPDPSSAIATNPGTYQAHYDALVAWVRTFPLVLDGGAVVSDPWDRYSLRPDYYLSDADQVHCNFAGNKAKARAFAAATFWDFPRPSPYQKITTNTYTAPDLSIYGGTKQIMGINRAAHVATLTSGTVTVSNTRITASSRVRLTRQAKNASSAIGNLTLGTITAGTSFVITALKADGTTETGDASTVLWEIIEPTP